MTCTSGIMFGLAVVSQIGPLTHEATLSTGLDSPARIAVTATGILIADTRADRIVRFDPAGTYVGAWIEPAGPVGIAVAADGRVFVSRRDDARVGIYDANFAFIAFLGAGAVTFSRPTDLAADPLSGRIFVVDSGADRVYAFDSGGGLALVFGIRGSGFGQFKYPSAIAIDPAAGRVLVADQDNFRVQVFDGSGVFLFSFGYRIKYLPGGGSEAWFQRSAGLAVDAAGRIYVADAHMGTVRLFSPSGAELGKVVGYGSLPGQLRNPCDVALDASGRVLVANSDGGTVETFSPAGSSLASAGVNFMGTNTSATDAATAASGVMRKLRPSVRELGPSGVLAWTLAAGGWQPPHMLADTPCARCHNVNGQPGGHEASVDGQTNLCLSCHTSGGHALDSAFRTIDAMSLSQPPPASGGRSHAWDVPAVNAAAGSLGPPAGSNMARYTSGGLIKCATCHNQHNHDAGTPYLRTGNTDGHLCLQCHADHVTHTPGGSWQPTCADCHDMHNPRSANLGLIATRIENRTLGTTKDVVFTARTGAGSYDDGEPTRNDGICQVCHTATSYHRHDGGGAAHNNGQNCLGCHPHANGFLPAGGDCMSCHAVAQDNGDNLPSGGRRAVVGEFPAGSAHAHYGAALDGGACLVCHSNDTHMDGYVDLLDPDDGSVYRFVRAADLTHSPDVSDFCAGCHDADGAARLAAPLDPFGGGDAPPDVASRFLGTLQWEEQYGDFCFGNEGMLRPVNSHHDISDADQAFSGARLECLNCHSAHGSSQATPIADPFQPTAAWNGSVDAFCLACHSGGTGPLDPGTPPGVLMPAIDTADPRWTAAGVNWSTILGGACLSSPCSAIRGIDSCDYGAGPWYVDYSWTHSAHGPDSKRGWLGYSGAPGAAMSCIDCHDAHGSYTAANPAGNAYMIRDFVDGSGFIDDGTRTVGFNGPPWDTTGASRAVVVTAAGVDVSWGAANGLCAACHAEWEQAYDFHSYCTGCQVCHGHGMAWGEADWVDFNDDTPCPLPSPTKAGITTRSAAPDAKAEEAASNSGQPALHRARLPGS
ncbi:MAG: SMP-30/gluconolactonase/LRE family protein [Planctomycetes bacterium]|nr:SMP-30/gluconolactonase/LRE family protein [Planctomycetota bacterium]